MFKIEGDILTKAVSFVSGIVSKSQGVSPILQNIKLTFDSNGLKLETTNTDISCTYTIDSSVIESKNKFFTTTVPAIKFNDILKKIASEKLSCKFSVAGERETILLKNSKVRFLLDCLPSSGYPSSRNLDYPCKFAIRASRLLSAINRVKFSICSDEARFYINGVLFDMQGVDSHQNRSLNIVSTDSHRLSVQSLEFNNNFDIPQVILPKRSVQKVVDILAIAKDEDAFVEINKTKIKISFGGCSVSSNLIEGEFPQYQRVVPQASNSHAIVKKQELLAAINTVSAIFSGSVYNVVKLTFNQNMLEVEASKNNKNLGSDIGIAKYKISCESSFDTEFSTSYNYSYINDVLNSIDSDYCKMQFTDSTKPSLVLPHTKDDSNKESESKEKSDYKFVIMPIRL